MLMKLLEVIDGLVGKKRASMARHTMDSSRLFEHLMLDVERPTEAGVIQADPALLNVMYSNPAEAAAKPYRRISRTEAFPSTERSFTERMPTVQVAETRRIHEAEIIEKPEASKPEPIEMSEVETLALDPTLLDELHEDLNPATRAICQALNAGRSSDTTQEFDRSTPGEVRNAESRKGKIQTRQPAADINDIIREYEATKQVEESQQVQWFSV